MPSFKIQTSVCAKQRQTMKAGDIWLCRALHCMQADLLCDVRCMQSGIANVCAYVHSAAACCCCRSHELCANTACCVSCQAEYLYPSRWLYKHNEKVEFEVQETGADLVIITCIKTAKWHDLMVERYCPQCAWLAAITKATQQVCQGRLLVLSPLTSWSVCIPSVLAFAYSVNVMFLCLLVHTFSIFSRLVALLTSCEGLACKLSVCHKL